MSPPDDLILPVWHLRDPEDWPPPTRCAYCQEAPVEVRVVGVGVSYAGEDLCLACYRTVVEEAP